MSGLSQWTTPALWALSALCLSANAPEHAALAAPLLLAVDLFQRSRQSPNTRTVNTVRQPTGQEKRKVRRLNGESVYQDIILHTEPSTRWGFATLINIVLTLVLLEHALAPRLLPFRDVEYARTSALSSDSARISVRLPGYDTSAIEYRPSVAGFPWQSTKSFALDSSRDWTAEVSLDHLQPGVQYEYRAEGLLRNFTTFPDSRLDSPFRFIFAGQPRYATRPYRPLAHHRQATWSGWFHQVKLDRIRSTAWAALGEWSEDMDARTAWAATRFALIGDSPRGTKMRQLIAGSGKAFERLPILPSRLKSCVADQAKAELSPLYADPEPAALTVPESQFSYGKTHVFRLSYPCSQKHEDDQDWRADVADLERRLTSVNSTEWKFIVTPVTLSPFFPQGHTLSQWQDAVLDILAYVPNVVVLAESDGDHRAEILRRNVIQVTSPSLDGGRHQEPDLTRAREEPVSTYIVGSDGIQVQQIAFEKVDRLLRQFPAGRANWLTVEVHGLRVYVVFVRDSEPIWRLEVIGEQPVSREVGTVGQSLQNSYKVHQMLAEAKIRDFPTGVVHSCRSNPIHNSTLYIIMGGKAQVLRDMRKRLSADQFEVQRRAFLYVARNTALPNTIRHKAQLGLNALNGGEGRMHAVKNRCVETGRGRGIMSKFGLWRYQFRLKALDGEIPGVNKASW